MFCPNCGKELVDGNACCAVCGFKPESEATVSSDLNPIKSSEVIDLRGDTSLNAPQEKKYKPLLWASILSIPVMILMIIAAKLFHAYVMQYSREMLIAGLLIVELPFLLLSIPFLLRAKAKHKLTGTNRKMQKGTAPLMYTLAILTVSVAMVCGFAGAFTAAGMLPAFATILFVVMAVLLVVYCNAISLQSGSEAYVCFAKAMTTAFALSAPVGFVLGTLLGLLEKALIVLIILIIAFFIFGGRVIIYREN